MTNKRPSTCAGKLRCLRELLHQSAIEMQFTPERSLCMPHIPIIDKSGCGIRLASQWQLIVADHERMCMTILSTFSRFAKIS